MAAAGMSRAEITVLIGCSRSTLAKHFADELKRGHARCRQDLVACMWAAARRGRVGAIVWLEQRMSEGAEGRTTPKGKKAQAKAAARAAVESSSWGDLLRLRPPPKQPPKAN